MAWNHPTIRSLSSYLSEKMGVPLDPEESNEGLEYGDRKMAESDLASEKYGHGVLDRVDNLSDEEALNELLRKE